MESDFVLDEDADLLPIEPETEVNPLPPPLTNNLLTNRLSPPLSPPSKSRTARSPPPLPRTTQWPREHRAAFCRLCYLVLGSGGLNLPADICRHIVRFLMQEIVEIEQWAVTISAMFTGREGTCEIGPRVHLTVASDLSVADFVRAVALDEANHHRWSFTCANGGVMSEYDLAILHPFTDMSIVDPEGENQGRDKPCTKLLPKVRAEKPDPNQPRFGQNCRFDTYRFGITPESAKTVSIRDIGLCDGAHLCQPAWGVDD